MRITILGINYHPERTGIGPYTTRIAQHLSKHHDVTVMTGLPHYPDWSVDASWDRRNSLRLTSGPRVKHFRHYVPSAQSAARRGLYELSWAVNAARSALFTRADLVLAVVPPLFGSVLAHAVARRYGAPVGIIVQDVMSAAAAQSGISGGNGVVRVATQIEGWALRRADGIVTIHPRLAAELASKFELRAEPDVIYNWVHLDQDSTIDTQSIRSLLGWGDSVVALHSGNMGLKQDLEAVVRAGALAAERGLDIKFVLAGGGNQFEHLAAFASGVPNVDVISGVPDAEYPSLLAAADVLLVNERTGMSSMSLPSKLTSYFTSGRPVIAATDDHSATAVFLRSAGSGVVVAPNDPDSLVRAIVGLTGDSEVSTAVGEVGKSFAGSHLREEAALGDYDAWVERLVARTR